jgi:hypothetical protein
LHTRGDGPAGGRNSASRRQLCGLAPEPSRSCATHSGQPESDSSAPTARRLDQPITAITKNYRRPVNTQNIICAHRRRVMIAVRCRPANRNDVIVARNTVTHRLDCRDVPGDGGYRTIPTITSPTRDQTGRIIHHHHRIHRRIRARVEHIIAPLKHWQNSATMPPTRRNRQPQPPKSSPDPETSRPPIKYGPALADDAFFLECLARLLQHH